MGRRGKEWRQEDHEGFQEVCTLPREVQLRPLHPSPSPNQNQRGHAAKYCRAQADQDRANPNQRLHQQDLEQAVPAELAARLDFLEHLDHLLGQTGPIFDALRQGL